MNGEEALKEYEALIKRAAAMDDSVDFNRLRMVYAETPLYDPYRDERDNDEKMFASYKDQDFGTLLECADRALANNPLYIIAHLMKVIACDNLDMKDGMALSQFMLQGLLRSVFTSPEGKNLDGKSIETAIPVIDVKEEYAVFQAVGCIFSGQELITQAGSRYDRIEVKKIGGEETAYIYFNVDIPYRWLERRGADNPEKA